MKIEGSVIEANDYKELLFNGITLLICGAGVIIYGIKKKNKT